MQLPLRRLFHGFARPHRTGEADHVGLAPGNDGRCLAMAQNQMLEQAFGQSGPVKRRLETLGHQQRLAGVLEHRGITGHQRRYDRVDRGQIGVVPRGDGKDHPQRFAPDMAGKAAHGRRHDIGQRSLGRFDHIGGAFFKSAQLAGAEFNRPAHLPGQFRHDLVTHLQHGRHRLAAQFGPLGNGDQPPRLLRGAGAGEGRLDILIGGQGPFGKNLPVNRGDAACRRSHDADASHDDDKSPDA